MNGANIHLALNHFPIVGLIIAVVLLLAGVLLKQQVLARAALAMTFVLALIAIPVNASGEEAEEVLEHSPYEMQVSHDVIHEHEEAAESAFYLMLAVGVMALGAFFLLRRNHPRATLATWITLITMVVVAGLMVRVGHLGGEIRHPEIISSDSGAPATPGLAPESQHEEEYDDD